MEPTREEIYNHLENTAKYFRENKEAILEMSDYDRVNLFFSMGVNARKLLEIEKINKKEKKRKTQDL